MKKFLFKFWPLIIIAGIWFIFSSPYFFKGLVPFPSKYLVTFFAPWSASYAMPVKNSAMPDVITQIYPWKQLTIETWKSGQIPLWNPYSFSGTVHGANYQSAIFSPFTILFWLLPMIDAWSVLVLIQPLFAGLFIYIFLRSLNRSQEGSLLGSLAFMFCGFIVVWMAYATLGYAVLWLPLLLYAVQHEFKKHTWWNFFLLTVGIAFSFLSGHFQISLYVAGLTICFIAWMSVQSQKWPTGLHLFIFFILGLLLASPQTFPSLYAFGQSVRSTSFGKGEVIPWQYLITFLAPDFFGNPVTRNDWFGHYAEWAGFIGVIPLFFALFACFRKKSSQEWFFILTAFLALFLALPTPLNDLLYALKVPVLATSSASRIIVLASFSFAVLSSYGLDRLLRDWKEKKKKTTVLTAIIWTSVISFVWLLLLMGWWLPTEKGSIAIHNFILPSVFTVSVILLTLVGFIKNRFIRSGIIAAFLVLSAFDIVRFSAKWIPFDPRGYVYPQSKVIEFLKKEIGFSRVFGNIGNEVATMFFLPSIEGYDAVYQGRYGEFIGTAADGTLRQPERSVVRIDKQGKFTEDVLQLLGVRFVVHRISDGQNVWAFPFWNYSQYKSVYRDEHFEVFENTNAYPRAFLASSYEVGKSGQEIIDMLWKKDFPRRTTVILEEKPEISPTVGDGTSTILKYSSGQVLIEVDTTVPKLLFLSDVYENGWKATIDGVPTPIYRADYAFRAIGVPKGKHRVEFIYDPQSVRLGFVLAGMTIVLLIIGSIKKIYENRHL